ncbi:MAG: hypothetical protein HYZ42_14570, partial [Bacteroidetes bacterium]|nr:hypothetical protein [Bacteroidota bacterium]
MKNFLAVLFLITFQVQAQDKSQAKETFSAVYYPNLKLENDFSIADINRIFHEVTGNNDNEVKELSRTQSLIGTHINYQILKNGIPIYHTFFKLNIAQSGQVISVYHNLLNISFQEKAYSSGESTIWYQYNNEFILTEKHTHDHFDDIYANGQLIYQYDLASYRRDTLIDNNIFNPDPITKSQTDYGILIVDSSDLNYAAFDTLYTLKNIPLSYQGDTVFFKNDYVQITNLTGNLGVESYTLAPMVKYYRDDANFEAMNCLYHIYHLQKYIQSLGFMNLTNFPLTIDPHGFSGDNSSFVPYYIKYGDGFVDDAEDAETITHEYGHSLIESASPGTNIGFERKSIDEGSCDYLATGYTKDISSYKWENVFPWDGHNLPFGWRGRFINSTKIYPTDVNNSSIHLTSEIWSSCLMQIANDIGRE